MIGMILYIIVINTMTMILFAIDKKRAIRHQWRVPERTLFLLVMLGGGIGAFIGMYTFHHKTRHMSFVIGVPLITIIEYLVLYLYLKPSL